MGALGTVDLEATTEFAGIGALLSGLDPETLLSTLSPRGPAVEVRCL